MKSSEKLWGMGSPSLAARENRSRAVSEFASAIDSIKPAFRRLVEMNPFRLDQVPSPVPAGRPGVYLLSESDRPLYVGRTRHVRGRLSDHRSSAVTRATLAVKMARIAAKRPATYTRGNHKTRERRPTMNLTIRRLRHATGRWLRILGLAAIGAFVFHVSLPFVWHWVRPIDLPYSPFFIKASTLLVTFLLFYLVLEPTRVVLATGAPSCGTPRSGYLPWPPAFWPPGWTNCPSTSVLTPSGLTGNSCT